MIVSHMPGSTSASAGAQSNTRIEPRPMTELGERRRDMRGERANIRTHQLRVRPAGFDAGEIEQRVD